MILLLLPQWLPVSSVCITWLKLDLMRDFYYMATIIILCGYNGLLQQYNIILAAKPKFSSRALLARCPSHIQSVFLNTKLDSGHPYYSRLTAVKKGYPRTSVT